MSRTLCFRLAIISVTAATLQSVPAAAATPTLAKVNVTVPGEYRNFLPGQAAFLDTNGPNAFWNTIPPDLGDGSLAYYYVGFDPLKTSSVEYGMLHFTVTTPGLLWMLTTNRYQNSGNSSGNWIPELTSPQQLAANGWVKLRSDVFDESGYGPAGTNPVSLQYDLWQASVVGGASFSIRTEKYAPPVILQNNIAGDADANGTVNFADFLLLSSHFGKSNAGWRGADFNGDGTTNFTDFLRLSSNFGGSLHGNMVVSPADLFPLEQVSGVSSIPEPASLAVLGSICFLATMGRKPKRS